ncbi:MAG: sigma-54 dependent transcriptional regulator [Burkholderiales bacterium]
MNRQPVVLVVDDELRSQEALRRTLEEEAQVITASSADEARRHLEREFVDVILCDQRMPGTDGVTFLKEARDRWPDAVRIIISGYADAEDIIAGVNDAGIYQYLMKPWHPDNLLASVRNAARLRRLQQDDHDLATELRTAMPVLATRVEARREVVRRRFDWGALVRAAGSPLDAVCRSVARVARYDIPVLLMGESGTGKELLARAIHYNSPRAAGAFVVENCAALPDTLLESELFGHKRGAFTGAFEDRVGLLQRADGGTLFLDEIGETSPMFQAKMLRALQEGEVRPIGAARPVRVNVRVITATNRDLEADVRSGRFREDLYYRLAGVSLHVPPLRERPMDIGPLAERLLERAVQALGRECAGFTPGALDALRRYRWPGNVRELQNEVQRMLAFVDGDRLGTDVISPRVLHAASEAVETDLAATPGHGGSLRERMEALEAAVLRETLLRLRGNKTQAARELGLSRVGLRAKLNRYGLESRDDDGAR